LSTRSPAESKQVAVGGLALFITLMTGAAAAALGTVQTYRWEAIIPTTHTRLIRAPLGTAVDDPVWLNKRAVLVTLWRQQFASLHRVALPKGDFESVRTLEVAGCHPTTAQFPTWKGREIAYLTSCFRPPTNRLPQKLSGLAVINPRSGRTRQLGSYGFSIGFNGRFSFSPAGTKGIIATGGLYSQLEWLTARPRVAIKQGLAVAEAPTWSPDGRLIAFGGVPHPNGDADVATLPTNLYTFRPRDPKRLHLVISGLHDFRPVGVSWMPHSSRLLVGSLHPAGQRPGLWLVDALSGRKALLIAGSEFGRPAISPDGRMLAVGVGIDAGLSSVEAPRVGLEIIKLPSENQLRSNLQ
jgi:hypothetical protein